MRTDPLVGFRDAPREPNKTRGTGGARVYNALKEEILCLKLRPGAVLDEVGLSGRFELSRSPVREALIRLASEGLVVILPNRSTVVAPMDLQGLPKFLDALDMLQRVVTRLAAAQRSNRSLREIKAAHLTFEKAAERGIRKHNSLPVIEANHDFHMTIARSGGNPYFVSFYRRLMDEGRRMLHLYFEYQTETPDLDPQVLSAEHAEMVKAIEERDVDLAEQLAHSHATQFRGRFMQYLAQNITADMILDDIGSTTVSD